MKTLEKNADKIMRGMLFALFIPICLLASGCVGKQSVQVERNCKVPPYLTNPICDYKITPVVDRVEIKKVIGNRGGCEATSLSGSLPLTRAFGKPVKVSFYGCSGPSDVIEVTVVTDSGEWAFSFE